MLYAVFLIFPLSIERNAMKKSDVEILLSLKCCRVYYVASKVEIIRLLLELLKQLEYSSK